MKFRKYLESGGTFDSLEDSPPAPIDRRHPMPGHALTVSSNDVSGQVVNIQKSSGKVIMTIATDAGNQDLSIDPDKYESDADEAPKTGDTIRAVVERDGTVADYQVVHRS